MERKKEREREGEKERKKEREKEGEREREKERKRDHRGMYIWMDGSIGNADDGCGEGGACGAYVHTYHIYIYR